MASLGRLLRKVAASYAHERVKPFAGSEFANFIRHEVAVEAKKQLVFWPFKLKVKASAGAGNWAAVPWLSFFDPIITEKATQGFYVVYLIDADAQKVVLLLNQGTTAISEEFGAKANEVLRRRALSMTDRVNDFAKEFDAGPISLNSPAALPLSYEAGHAFGRTYGLDELESPAFIGDLQKILFAYEALVDRGGLLPFDVMQEEAGGSTNSIVETRKYVLSKRIERATRVRKEVFTVKPPVCEACGLDPAKQYAFKGRIVDYPLDVHHSRAIYELSEGESRRYKVPEDFMVLCPTCHRMIHKQADVSDLELLRSQIRVKH